MQVPDHIIQAQSSKSSTPLENESSPTISTTSTPRIAKKQLFTDTQPSKINILESLRKIANGNGASITKAETLKLIEVVSDDRIRNIFNEVPVNFENVSKFFLKIYFLVSKIYRFSTGHCCRIFIVYFNGKSY